MKKSLLLVVILLILSFTYYIKNEGIMISTVKGEVAKFTYDKSFTVDSSNSMLGIAYITEYKLYNSEEGKHIQNILVANFKERKQVVVTMEDISRGYYDVITRKMFNYTDENLNLDVFGLSPKGNLLPKPVGVRFISKKFEHLSLFSLLAYEGYDQDIYVMTIK